MKTNSLFVALLALLSISSAFAQRPTTMTMPAPKSGPMFSAAVSLPYATRMERVGISAEAGSMFSPGNFLGFEATYFNPRETDYTGLFAVNSREDVTTTLLLYRYSFSPAMLSPVGLYAGGGIGAGFTQLRSNIPALGSSVSDRSRGNLAAEVQAGATYEFTSRWGVKLGYRYFRIYDVELFGQKDKISDSMIEAGATYRF